MFKIENGKRIPQAFDCDYCGKHVTQDECARGVCHVALDEHAKTYVYVTGCLPCGSKTPEPSLPAE